jgi:hypothetical protein
MITVFSNVTSLFTWAEQNPAVAVPALITASAVIIGALAAAVVKAGTDIVIARLNRSNGKGDPQHRKPKSPFR